MEQRKVADCRAMPGSTCSVTLAGSEAEVLPLAVRHAVEAHGYEDTPETYEKIRASLTDE